MWLLTQSVLHVVLLCAAMAARLVCSLACAHALTCALTCACTRACAPPLQRHWTWNAIDQSFRLHTAQLGDVHHYAWRANRPNETVHMQARDAIRCARARRARCIARPGAGAAQLTS